MSGGDRAEKGNQLAAGCEQDMEMTGGWKGGERRGRSAR